MNKVWIAACCVLLAAVAYQWVENSALQMRADQAGAAATEAGRELQRLREQIGERDRQLEVAQTALSSANRDSEQDRAAQEKADPAVRIGEKSRGEAVSPFVKNVLSLAERAAELDKALKGFPGLDIPEISLLKETDWMEIASGHPNLGTVGQVKQALQQLTQKAQFRAGNLLMNAVMESGDAANLKSLDAVRSSLSKTMGPDLIQRYELVPASQFDAALQKYVSEQVVSGNGGDVKRPLLVVRGREPVEGKQLLVIYSRAQAADGKISTQGTHMSLRAVNPAR